MDKMFTLLKDIKKEDFEITTSGTLERCAASYFNNLTITADCLKSNVPTSPSFTNLVDPSINQNKFSIWINNEETSIQIPDPSNYNLIFGSAISQFNGPDELLKAEMIVNRENHTINLKSYVFKVYLDDSRVQILEGSSSAGMNSNNGNNFNTNLGSLFTVIIKRSFDPSAQAPNNCFKSYCNFASVMSSPPSSSTLPLIEWGNLVTSKYSPNEYAVFTIATGTNKKFNSLSAFKSFLNANRNKFYITFLSQDQLSLNISNASWAQALYNLPLKGGNNKIVISKNTSLNDSMTIAGSYMIN